MWLYEITVHNTSNSDFKFHSKCFDKPVDRFTSVRFTIYDVTDNKISLYERFKRKYLHRYRFDVTNNNKTVRLNFRCMLRNNMTRLVYTHSLNEEHYLKIKQVHHKEDPRYYSITIYLKSVHDNDSIDHVFDNPICDDIIHTGSGNNSYANLSVPSLKSQISNKLNSPRTPPTTPTTPSREKRISQKYYPINAEQEAQYESRYARMSRSSASSTSVHTPQVV